jgi:hypothetical protein
MTTNNKTSLLISSQFPQFIRESEDYSKFVSFVEAYYQWMEQEKGISDYSKNILNYRDIDETVDEFIRYFINDFLPYFPQDALIDKKKAIKVARTLYDSKGTPASYQFLFRILFNSDFEVFNTSDAVLKASAGSWYISKSLKILSGDVNFLDTQNLLIFCETTKAFATIENATKTQPDRIQVFISTINRTFQSGEFVRILDGNFQDVLFNGQPLRAKIIGEVNQIAINQEKRGVLYQKGDPVIVYGALSPGTANANSAIAEVDKTSTGSIQRINVVKGGWGFLPGSNTFIRITNAQDATALVTSVNTAVPTRANVTYFTDVMIGAAQNTTIGNATYTFITANSRANVGNSLANSLTFSSFTGYPIQSVIVTNGGTGVYEIPEVDADSVLLGNYEGNFALLRNLGILAPVIIKSGGRGYRVNDRIVFTGGSGYGANAIVSAVNATTNAITSIAYTANAIGVYSLGGMGYRSDDLPTVTVVSANNNATGALLVVDSVLGDGAEFSPSVDRAGAVNTIRVTNGGTDYIGTPNVSFRVQDILVANVSLADLPKKGDTVYQYTIDNVSAYKATVNSISILQTDRLNPTKTKFNLRVFEYYSAIDVTQPLKILDKKISMNLVNQPFANNFFYRGSPKYDRRGVKTYGDGTAKGTASYLNGVVTSEGRYMDSKGQLSSFDVLQNEVYNNFTYEITVSKEISKYRDILLNVLHPSGTNVYGKYRLDSANTVQYAIQSSLKQGHTLYYYTNNASSNAYMGTTFDKHSTNVVRFLNIGANTNIANFIFANSYVRITPSFGPNIYSKIVSVNQFANTITLEESTFLTYQKVAVAKANAFTNTINILSLTGAYDIINGGVYSNTRYPLKDIVYAGDKVTIPNNGTKTVTAVDYVNGVITISDIMTANANGLMTVIRNFVAGGSSGTADQIIFYGPVGIQYFPELTTEDGRSITTEDGNYILLG